MFTPREKNAVHIGNITAANNSFESVTNYK
jgi:hypothetical protein